MNCAGEGIGVVFVTIDAVAIVGDGAVGSADLIVALFYSYVEILAGAVFVPVPVAGERGDIGRFYGIQIADVLIVFVSAGGKEN